MKLCVHIIDMNNDWCLIPITPYYIRPKKNGSEAFSFDDEKYDIHAFGYTLSELIKDTLDEIVFAWEEYAEADDEILDSGALNLKRKLLLNFRKVAKKDA